MQKEKFMQLAKDNKHMDSVFEARNELMEYCENNWDQVTQYSKFAYKRLWEIIANDKKWDLDNDHDLAYDIYSSMKSDLTHLQSLRGKATSETAQMECEDRGGVNLHSSSHAIPEDSPRPTPVHRTYEVSEAVKQKIRERKKASLLAVK